MTKIIILLCITVFTLKTNAQEWILNLDTSLISTNYLIDNLKLLKEKNKLLDLSTASNSTEKTKLEIGKIFYSKDSSETGKIEIFTIGKDDAEVGNVKISQLGQSINPMKSSHPINIVFYSDRLPDLGEKIRADKIIGFEKGGKYYFSKKTTQEPPFYVEKILSGYINLYTFRYHYTRNHSGEYNYQPSTIEYKIEYYIETDDEYIERLSCFEIKNFITKNFSEYPEFITIMTKKKHYKKYSIEPCKYILELVQLKNNLEREKISTASLQYSQ
ncbi:MAG: hypothetical protein M0P66_14810 [Salinivirgaceae bacterium]|nr:hypothetical protein [Salinivirgaceae bacterium]